MYKLTLKNHAGVKEYDNLDGVFKTIRKIVKNSDDGEIIEFELVRRE